MSTSESIKTNEHSNQLVMYYEICELDQIVFNPKCYKECDFQNPQVCRKCHARFCCECILKPFLSEFIDLKLEFVK